MKRLNLFAAWLSLGGFLLTGECTLLADNEANLAKSFTVTPGGSLVVAASRGSIEIVSGTDDKLDVQVFRKVTRASASKAREILEGHEVAFTQEGNTVTVRDQAPSSWSNWNWWGGGNLQVRYVVTLPRKFDLDLKTAGGSITVPDQAGKIAVATSGGSLKLGAIEGPVTAHTSGGGIHVVSATETIEAKTAGGSIEVGETKSAANLGTSGGSIRVKLARAALTARTSGGNIDIAEAQGAVDATTSGGSVSAALAGSPTEDCRLATSGGSVNLKLPTGVNANLDAKTSGGGVHSDLPVSTQGTAKRSELVGKLGDGGRQIKLRTSGGSIKVSKL